MQLPAEVKSNAAVDVVSYCASGKGEVHGAVLLVKYWVLSCMKPSLWDKMLAIGTLYQVVVDEYIDE